MLDNISICNRVNEPVTNRQSYDINVCNLSYLQLSLETLFKSGLINIEYWTLFMHRQNVPAEVETQ